MKSLKRRGFIKKSLSVSAGVAFGAPAYIKGFAHNSTGWTGSGWQ